MNERALKLLLTIDPFLATWLHTYRQLVFIITKDPNYSSPASLSGADVDAVLNFEVPPHVLHRRNGCADQTPEFH